MIQLLAFFSLILSVIANGDSQIVQQNIGIPGDVAGDDSFGESGASRSASALAPSSGPHDYVSQQNIGIPGDFGSGASAGGSRSPSISLSSSSSSAPGIMFGAGGGGIDMVSVGGMGPIPLAVNSRHSIQYVDMPSTMMRVSPSGSSAAAGGGYVQQQNIGIPGDYSGGFGMMRGGGISRPTGSATGGGFTSQRKINGYGSGASSGGGYGSRSGVPSRGPSSFGGAGGGSVMSSGGHSGGVIHLPVISRHRIEYVDVPSTGNIQPVHVEIPATNLGVMFNFKSSSSPIKVTQSHEPSGGSYQETSSVEEPIRLSHTVTRPIIQELRETVQPFRKVTQEVHPVQEDIRTIIAVRGGSMRGGGRSYPGPSGAGGYSSMSMNSGGAYGRPRGAKTRPGAISSGASSPAATARAGVSGSPSGWSSAGPSGGYPSQQKISGTPDSGWSDAVASPMAPTPDIGSDTGGVPGETMNSAGSLAGTRSRKKKPGGANGDRRFYDGSYGRGAGQQKIGQEKIYRK